MARENRKKTRAERETGAGHKPLNIALIGIGGVFIVLLVGAVIVMGSLLHQFTQGGSLFGQEPPRDISQGTLVIRDTPAPGTEDGAEGDGFSMQEVARSVVLASATVRAYGESGGLEPQHTAFGVVIHENGYVLTSSPVALAGGTIEVLLNDGSSHSAKLIGYDVKTDIAVVKIEAENLRTAPFGSASLAAGDRFLYIGLGQRGLLSVSEGMAGGSSGVFIDTAAGFSYQRLVATDRFGTSAHSGGVAVNYAGQIVGVRMQLAEDAYPIVYIGAATELKSIVDDIIEYGYATGRVTLGYSGTTVSETMASASGMPRGVLVDVLEPDGGLSEAGIETGDIITAISGAAVASVEELQSTVQHISSERATLRVYRPSENRSFEVQVRLYDDPGIVAGD